MNGEWRRVLLYLGGMMGPLGTFVMLPMIPELRDTFEVTTGQIGWAVTLYLLPFAGLLLVSGTIGERWGRGRTLRWAFALYAVATAACALAPSYVWFLAGRVCQGALNAFITPLLLATLTETTSAGRLGRIVGRYAAFQSLGQLGAPLVGGICADVNWRMAFWFVAAVAAAIAVALPDSADLGRRAGAAAGGVRERPRLRLRAGPSSAPEPGLAERRPLPADRPPLRSLLRKPTLLVAVTAGLAATGPLGASLLVSVSGRDVMGLSGSQAGVLVMGGSFAAMVAAPSWGIVLDHWGGRRAGVAALMLAAGLVALLATARSAWLLAVIWFVCGAAVQAVVVSFQSLAAVAAPDNRAGALSFVLSLRFGGHALGAVIWLPLFGISSTAAYLGSAAVGTLAIVTLLVNRLDTQNA